MRVCACTCACVRVEQSGVRCLPVCSCCWSAHLGPFAAFPVDLPAGRGRHEPRKIPHVPGYAHPTQQRKEHLNSIPAASGTKTMAGHASVYPLSLQQHASSSHGSMQPPSSLEGFTDAAAGSIRRAIGRCKQPALACTVAAACPLRHPIHYFKDCKRSHQATGQLENTGSGGEEGKSCPNHTKTTTMAKTNKGWQPASKASSGM